MSGTAMPNGTGTFCWNRLHTPDLEAAEAFYGELLGWETLAQEPGLDLARRAGEGDPVASFAQARDRAGAWIPFVRVADLEEAHGRVLALGGRVVMAPVRQAGVGRHAIVADPAGALMGLCEPEGDLRPPAGPGAFHWFELVTHEEAACRRFYEDLLGWRFEEGIPALAPYTLIFRAEDQVGGLWHPEGPGWAGSLNSWLPYVQAPHVDRLASLAKDLGGQVRVQPTDVPAVGRFTVVEDPTGGVLALVQFEA
jgi:hypothetical protein